MDTVAMQKFETYHVNNPHIYDKLVDMTRYAKAKGKEKLGICMLWEKLRWDMEVEMDAKLEEGDRYKFCNNHKPYYARLIMQNEPDLQGMFDLHHARDIQLPESLRR